MPHRLERVFAHRFGSRVVAKAAFGFTMVCCLVWALATALAQAGTAGTDTSASSAGIEWPTHWDGVPVRPLAPSAVEQHFARQFPGAMARLTDGHQVLVLRHVTAPTRMLHPATDCYRALGYRIQQARLEHDAQQRRWRCFTATRAGAAPLRVCERIVDAQGQAFTDTSAWYWAAVGGASHGPWQAVTTAALAAPDGGVPAKP